MQRKSRLASLIVICLAGCLLAIGMTAMSFASPPKSYAATSCVGGGGSAPTINSVVPSTVNNNANTVVTIIGSGFINGASVVLEGFGAIPTTWDSATQLTATIPAGIPGKPGGKTYNVDVFNPTATPKQDCDVIGSGLTVIGSAPTAAPATAAPTTFMRPQMVVASYTASVTHVSPSQNFDFSVTLQSVGQTTARNVTATFVTGDLIPRDNGGVHYAGDLDPGATVGFQQPMRVSGQVNKAEAVIRLIVAYNDSAGKAYTDTFDVAAFPLYYAAATPTPMPTLAVHPQIMLTGYQTTPATLNPGSSFQLDMDIINVSGELARQVVFNLNMNPSSGSASSGASASSGVIAPLNSSATRYLDQLAPGQSTHLTFNMMVSGSASGQLVPVSLDVSYMDSGNTQHSQSESLSLRIETVPFLYVHFLTPPTQPLVIGETVDLAVEAINIGQNKLNVSTIEVTSDTMTIGNGLLYIGPLDAGTSGVVPAQARPELPGLATVIVTVHYLDDYQQEKTFSQNLTVEVADTPTATPEANQQGTGGGFAGGSNSDLTFVDRVVRALLGFFGVATRTGGGLNRGGNFGGNNNLGGGSQGAATPGSAPNNGDGNFVVPAP